MLRVAGLLCAVLRRIGVIKNTARLFHHLTSVVLFLLFDGE